MAKWYDLGKQGVQLRFFRDDTSKRAALVIMGLQKDSPEWRACLEPLIGFKPSPTGKPVLIKSFMGSASLKLAALRTAFPAAREIEISSPAEVRLRLDSGRRMTPQEVALTAAMQIASPIGLNAMGQRVFEMTSAVEGRFLLDKDGNRIDEGRMPAALFLRGTADNLAACAQGFVVGLMSGEHANASDVKRFVDIIYGADASNDQVLVERVSRAIEVEMTNRLLDRHQIAGDSAYREAQSLYENSPPHMGEPKGAGAVPLPVAVAVQEIVRGFSGDTQSQTMVYVPAIFDGAMAAMLGPQFLTVADQVDPASREGQMRKLMPRSINLIERAKSEPVPEHRVNVLNVEDPGEQTLAGLRQNLNWRNPLGLSILLVPEYVGDSDEVNAEDRARMAKFIRDLQGDFEIHGAGVVSGVMRRKLGLNSGLYMITVGRRYSKREKQLRGNDWAPAEVVSMYDWDALRTFTNDVLVRVHEAAGHKLTAEQEAALRSNEAVENSYQLPYQSFSQNGEVELMIPRNLAGATYKALHSLQARVGDLDQYVKNACGFSDEVFARLAPEQVDAGALMIAALDRRRGFLLGDQTGAGKGVTLAIGVAFAWQRGWPVVFNTKQDSLFSDFYRDLKRLDLHHKMRPLILNHGATMVDQFSENLDKIEDGIARKEFLQNYQFGLSAFDNPNLIFATYSQFSSAGDSEKSAFIKSIAPNAVAFFDESHIAAGDSSNMGHVLTEVSDTAIATVKSSATWLKDARQMRFYQRELPESVDAEMVAGAMEAGGENIQEIFTAMLAEDGVFIRRERDASELEILSEVDTSRLATNERIANDVSLILQGLQRLCGVTDQVGRRLKKEQIEKLDAAQGYIRAALDRAKIEVMERRQAARRAAEQDAVDAQGVAEAADRAESLETALNTLAQQVEPAENIVDEVARAQQEIDTQNQIRDNILPSEEPDDAPLVHMGDLTLADLGFSEDVAKEIGADIEVLSGDAAAAKRLEKRIRQIQDRIKQVTSRTTAFGNLLFTTQRALNVSLQARFAAERAIDKIRAGQKPIIFLEQTFETRLAEMLESPDAIKNDDGTISIRPLTLKDNLRELYRSIVNITHVNAEGEKFEGTIMDSQFMASDEEKEVVREGLRTLDEMIDGLPDDLFCSPIDTICHAIREAGFTVGEATGRKYHVVEMRDGEWRVALRKKSESKVSYIERGFNFGELDAIVGNKAMSTGMSLHASKDFSDQRQRVMMFCQLFGDINDYIQAIGRADRRGQVIPPLVEMLASGLPSEARLMMNHYDKLRKLLASTTSNRSSRYEQMELPDLFNSVGDTSVRDYLQANPGVATRLGIPFAAYMPSAINESGREVEPITRGLAKFVVARLDLLQVNESRAVYQEISHNFEEVLRELDAQGVNPLRTNVIDLTKKAEAGVVKKEDLLPAALNREGGVDSVFDEAVELHTVVSKEMVSARTWEDTLAEIEQNTRAMYLQGLEVRAAGSKPDFVPDLDVKAIYQSAGQDAAGPLLSSVKLVPSGLRERVEKAFTNMKIMMASSDAARLNMGAESAVRDEVVQAARASDERPMVGQRTEISPLEVLERRKNWLLQNLQYLMPGQYVSFSLNNFGWSDYRAYSGVVTELITPPKARETNLSRWAVKIQVPGYDEPFRLTLQELYKHRFAGMGQWLPACENMGGLLARPVPEEFNDFRSREHTSVRYVLRGNLFRAASIVAGHNLGAGGVLQLKNQAPVRVVSIRKGIEKQDIYAKVPAEISRDDAVGLFCSAWEGINRPAEKQVEYWRDFLQKSIESRSLHSGKEAHESLVAIYWLPTKTSWMSSVRDGLTDEEVAEARASEAQADRTTDALAGIGVRVAKSLLTDELRERLINEINLELGYPGAQVMRGRESAKTVRIVVRFKNREGNRDEDAAIRAKIAIMIRQVTDKLDVKRLYASSSEMRLLALAASARAREQAYALRDAAEEARQMRQQMSRMHFGDDNDIQEEEGRADDDQADELPVMG